MQWISATALRGEMRSPYRWRIEPQGVAALAAGVGRSSCLRGHFDAVTGASFDSAESLVEGSRCGDGAHETLARVTIEGLDLLGLVTADRIAVQVRRWGPEDPTKRLLEPDEGAATDAAFTQAGMEIVNLRVLGAPVSFGSPAGCRIPIADLGVLHLAEESRSPGCRRLTMVRLELNGRLQGELAAGLVEVGSCPRR